MKTIDVKGELCPKPLIIAKQTLTAMQTGEELEIITDSETSLHNLMTFLTALKAQPSNRKEGNIWYIKAIKPAGDSIATVRAEDYCEVPPQKQANDYVIVIKSNQMGQGDEALGKILIRGFINALKEQETLPTHMILYNSGVQLALKETDTAQSLTDLEKKGVTVIVCGTCVDFYQIKEDLGVGMISNMLHITSILQKTGKVIYP